MAKSPCENCRRECPKRGCPDWRKWFVKNWNDNICRRPPEQKTREVFTYEHPDRVREMAPKKPEEMTAAEWMAKQMGVKEDA
jgi:hypothetical protein